jgi:hypothetical protein
MKVCKLAIMFLLKIMVINGHKAQIVDIDMENNFALIKWETTQNIAYVDLDNLKRFSMDDSAPRKQKNSQISILPLQVKKLHQLSNVKITDLICIVAQKIGVN